MVYINHTNEARSAFFKASVSMGHTHGLRVIGLRGYGYQGEVTQISLRVIIIQTHCFQKCSVPLTARMILQPQSPVFFPSHVSSLRHVAGIKFKVSKYLQK